MSQDRKNLKIMSLILLFSSLVLLVIEILLPSFQAQMLLYRVGLIVLSAASIVVGYLGAMAANVPSRSMSFLVGAIVVVVAGIVVTLIGPHNVAEGFAGLIESAVSGIGLIFGRKVRESSLK